MAILNTFMRGAELEYTMNEIEGVIAALYDLETYASDTPAKEPEILDKVRSLITALKNLEGVDNGVMVPQDVVEYLDAGRNPNVYTRQFIESIQRENAAMKARMEGYERAKEELQGELQDYITS